MKKSISKNIGKSRVLEVDFANKTLISRGGIFGT